MEEYEDLDAYNSDTVHDMNVDFDFNFNEDTGELPEYFDEADMDDFINNLNNWD